MLLVAGVGAVLVPVPPLAEVYHSKVVPVAVRGDAAAPIQYTIGVVTIGAEGVGFMVTIIESRLLSQPKLFVWLT
jgi:hypothetical protein